MIEKMMSYMMSRMSKEDKEEMMDKMMGEFFAGMTAEDKQNMMAAMMPKMMEGMNFMEMMPQMMTGMMGSGEGMAKMCGGSSEAGTHEGAQPPMMQSMMTHMMPQCLETMLPQLPRDERREFVLRMVSTLARKGCADMPEDERADLMAGINKRVESILGRRATAA